MLRLERMLMSGFKSFSETTDVAFPHGITAVVGPNGCGKSNIGDAINWVLGEQSPKLLRGKQMADVIFNGSERRKPLGMAEVKLVFSGAAEFTDSGDGELSITRRLFRSGESDYLINGRRARLKDIQEVLDRGRVGARSYATIEQGRIDQILNAKPRDRRQIIEDAAGISGYKHKRRLTEIKLEATQANLLRVNDIVVEVERQIRSLKRQAAKARRYRRLREELREREQLQFGLRAAASERELETCRHAEAQHRDAESAAAAGLARLDAGVAERRDELERLSEAFRRSSERLHQLELSIDREESQVRGARERIDENHAAAERMDAEANELEIRSAELRVACGEQEERVAEQRWELERIARDLDGAQCELGRVESDFGEGEQAAETSRREQFEVANRVVELRNRVMMTEETHARSLGRRSLLESERETARTDRSRLEEEGQSLTLEHEGHRKGLEELRDRLEKREQELRRVRERHSAELQNLAETRERKKSAVARLATLEDVATRFAGVSDGVRALLAAGPSSGVRTLGVVADFIQAGTEVERAAERYLDWFLPTVIVEDDGDVHRATALLRESGAGRISLISRSQPVGGLAVGAERNGHAELPEEVLRDPRVQGRLLDRLALGSSANGTVQERVGDAVLVDSLESALDLHRLYPTADYLTREGEVVYASGVVVTGGGSAGNNGLLAHNRRVGEAQLEAAEAAAEEERLSEQAVRSRTELAGIDEALRELRLEMERAGQRRVELEMRLSQSVEETRRTERRSAVLEDEISAVDGEGQALEQSLVELRAELERTEHARASAEGTLRGLLEGLDETRARLRTLGEEAATRRAEHAARGERLAAGEGEAQRLGREVSELEERVAERRREAAAARERAEKAETQRADNERALVDHLQQRESLSGETSRMEREIGDRQRISAEEDARQKSSREELDRLRETTREAELERIRVESARTHLDELCRRELGIDAAEALAAAGDALEGVDPEAIDAEVIGIRERIEKIGPVNMTAIEEFAELEERHAFLTAQRADLDQSMGSLKETIRRINRSSRERFLSAFEQVRGHFQESFRLLFNGGRGDLQLEEGEDALDCGIEILVQPPGKRLGNIQLMSGGEKALSAIALLFAVFRYQPSPFCLLDEVDAPLDDVNVGRFTRLLREYCDQTQFVLITHNKLSMESADLLYGVTMAEPGVSKLISLQLQ